jgi:hypothetical protein
MIINTKLDIAHKELIKIFLKANELDAVTISEEPLGINGRLHMVIGLKCTHEPTAEALTFMGLRHCGVLNMLDDYLLKCGVFPDALQPVSINRQIQEEREQRLNEDFLLKFEKLKTSRMI